MTVLCTQSSILDLRFQNCANLFSCPRTTKKTPLDAQNLLFGFHYIQIIPLLIRR